MDNYLSLAVWKHFYCFYYICLFTHTQQSFTRIRLSISRFTLSCSRRLFWWDFT